MKWILLVSSFFFVSSAFSQKGDTTSNRFYSKIFSDYSRCYESLIVYYLSGSMLVEEGRCFVIIGMNKNETFLIRHHIHVNQKDSITKKPLISSQKLLQLMNDIPKLKSENQIKVPCSKKTVTVLSRDTVLTEISDLNLHSDLNSAVIEYKIEGKKGIVQQLEPELAVEICPDLYERRKFFDVTNTLKELN